jgi:hypothetical protein
VVRVELVHAHLAQLFELRGVVGVEALLLLLERGALALALRLEGVAHRLLQRGAILAADRRRGRASGCASRKSCTKSTRRSISLSKSSDAVCAEPSLCV